MIDKDGKFKYSSIVTVNLKTKNNISIFPSIIEGNSINLKMADEKKGLTN